MKSLLQQAEEKLPQEKKINLLVTGFDGITKKGTITEDGYNILSEEMEKRGYNQARQDFLNSIPTIFEMIKTQILEIPSVKMNRQKFTKDYSLADQITNEILNLLSTK